MKRAAPRRTCLGCRQVRPQSELIRLVRGLDGRARVDSSAAGGEKGTGRGAYACATVDCLTGALRKGRLDHAFRLPTRAPEQGPDEILMRWVASGKREAIFEGLADGG